MFARALTIAAVAGLVSVAVGGAFDPDTTQMPGSVFDAGSNGTVVSAELGYMSAPAVYWSGDDGTSWVKLNSPPRIPAFPGHHSPTNIDLRHDGLIFLWVSVGEMGPTSPWNDTPIMHWHPHTAWTADLGETWTWDTQPPAAAQGWHLYE